MADILSRIDRYLDVLEKIDYVRLAKNGLIVFSLAIIHYFGFIYFAFGHVPPFVDIRSFANLTFNAAALLAVSGLVGRGVTLIFIRFVAPTLIAQSLEKRRDKHWAHRVQRRRANQLGQPGNEGRISTQNIRNFHHNIKFMDVVVFRASRKFELPIMVLATTFCFFIFYLGWQITLICLGLVATVAFWLFLAYAFISFLHDYAQTLLQKEILESAKIFDGSTTRWSSVEIAHIIFLLVRYILSDSMLKFLASGVLKTFIITSFGLLLGATALIVGASRAAHSLDASTYTVELLPSEVRVDPLQVKIALVTSTGIMGINQDGDEPTFIPFNGVVSVRRPLTEPADSGFYRDRLMGYLPFYD
jgi:hypothetical protein